MRALALLAAAAMAVSLFLPWLQFAGVTFVPWDLIRHHEPSLEVAQNFIRSNPPELLAFLATFLLAAIFALLAILGMPSRILAFLAGGGAAGLAGLAFWRAREGLLQVDPRIRAAAAPEDFWNIARDLLQIGAWAWGIGALILLLSAAIGFGQRR